VWVVAAVAFVIIFASLAMIVIHHNKPVIKAASPIFCIWILLSDLLVVIGAVFQSLSPEGDYVCDLRVWFTGLGVIGALSALLAKTQRIANIFNNPKLSKKEHYKQRSRSVGWVTRNTTGPSMFAVFRP
jgi:predicted membrane channel-forming protein YqfA (hemolysin III family)